MAAEEGLLTETEKKRNIAEKGKIKKHWVGDTIREGGDDEFSLLQGRPMHVPALS